MANRAQRRAAEKVKTRLTAGLPTYELTTTKTDWFIPDFLHRLLVNYTVRRLAKVNVK